MSKLPSMPFFPADFFADTAHMTGEAAAVYLVLLGHAWLRGGSLPDDDRLWGRLARVSAQKWTTIKPEILPLWQLGPDGRVLQKRLTRDYEQVIKKLESNAKNGLKGNEKRWRKSLYENNGDGIANATNSHPQSRSERDRNQNQNQIKEDSFNNEIRQEGRWVRTKRIGGRIFKAGEKAPKYENQPVRFWEILKPEDCG